jgi:hypothetical protein
VTRQVTLYTRRLCGLCDEAAEELRLLRDELRFTLVERDIDDDPELAARYNDIVPVIEAGGRVIAHAPLEPASLRPALAAALSDVRTLTSDV